VCRLADGSAIPLSINSKSLIDESGETIGAIIIFRDLREIQILEKKVERTQRLASMGRMAAGIAREIRNPLSSIKGFAQYFRNKFDKGSDDWKYADVIVSEVDRLNRVIQDLLNFAKPLNPKLQKIEIEKTVTHSLKLVEEDLNKKRINVSVKNENISGYLLGDEDQLVQMFLNLFINAVEATEYGGKITIDVEQKEKHFQIKITDNGKGIDEGDIQKIFDPFFTMKKSGTGLGLAIVHRITEIHNGEISVTSKPKVGTTFIIKLPVRIEAHEK
jgi:two-component system sensor histidine kinase HydH